MKKIIFLIISLILTCRISYPAIVRVKDIAKVEGVCENQLIGYGIVVGLSKTGDTKAVYSTLQSVINFLKKFGINVPAEQIGTAQYKNVAAVVVTASLPPFAKSGDYIDVTVSSLGDATSLEGGTLLFTPLVAGDNNVYATAQGPISIGGFNVTTAGKRVQKNHPLVGKIPRGGLICKNMNTPLLKENTLTFVLYKEDFWTSKQLSEVINRRFGNISIPVDASSVRIEIPENFRNNVVSLIAEIENLSISPQTTAKVVINEKTGTVIIGGDVKILPVAISHGNLSITVKETPVISQPPSFSGGTTQVVPKTQISVKEEKRQIFYIPERNRVEDLVKALNNLGVTPRDMIAIIQAIKEAGALLAEVEII
jgi:flagellar P-ring protein precursor FlgI